jgi:hypothetical protein
MYNRQPCDSKRISEFHELFARKLHINASHSAMFANRLTSLIVLYELHCRLGSALRFLWLRGAILPFALVLFLQTMVADERRTK